jgi:hypothetical protein
MGRNPRNRIIFDNVGDYKHHLIVQHLAYLQRQDGSLFDDNLDQCVFDAQVSEPLQEIVFHDAHETELTLPPEDSHPEPTSHFWHEDHF